ncbi:MAG TPA: phage tail protein [Bacteroidetes bacterium]|nr:phage tail protein [Bacteroidota bacterium]
MNQLKLILVNPNPLLCIAWQKYFSDLPNVEIAMSEFETLPEFDCMVSAANSFGLMDGGVDEAIIQFFGKKLMSRIQHRIINEYLGEQPVGTSLIIKTGHPKHPFIAHTPTMRVPMEIARTDNVYRAMWAMLLAIRKHNQYRKQHINTIACPGLGTATGQVPYPEAARQMSLAYKNFLYPPDNIDWGLAIKRQKSIRYGGDRGYTFPPETKL